MTTPAAMITTAGQPTHAGPPRPGRPARRRRGDRGSVTVEIALAVPLMVLLLFLLTAAVHLGRAAIDVNSAAAAASRAASLARTAPAATIAARNAATADLAGQCATVSVTVDTSAFHRGGAVTVTVACTVTTHGLTGISIPGSVTTTAASTSPIDLYRTVALGARHASGPSTARGGDPT
jgi:Flp pilus assembly protein TadG